MMSADDDTVQLFRSRMLSLVEEKKEQQKLIELLNQRNLELTEELEGARDRVMLLEATTRQLKIEVSNKWRVEERNEWRALVDSLQKDRAALQEENQELLDQIEVLKAGQGAADSERRGGTRSNGHASNHGEASSSAEAQELKKQVEQLRQQLKTLRANQEKQVRGVLTGAAAAHQLNGTAAPVNGTQGWFGRTRRKNGSNVIPEGAVLTV
mmetsp:Transcript_9116/g.34361  ORF Transcript_9116/g.34361 Transcript_9116/m.34361 type:complete len:211 (-) Transcript_9116:1134-1766(-)